VKVSPSASTDWATAIHLNPPQSLRTNGWTPFSGSVVATGTNMTLWLDGETTVTQQFKAADFDSVTVSCALTPVPLRFESVAWLLAQQAQLVLNGTAGSSATVLSSSDLSNWLMLTNLILTNGTAQFIDESASNAPQRFYRATSP
jgi:hypothetical protein